MATVIWKGQQGSPKWLKKRIGIPTASRIGDIVTSTGKPTKSAARQTYLAELVMERLTGMTSEHFKTAAMQRGIDAEPHARTWYALTTDADVQQIGIAIRVEEWGSFGASPDGLIGDDGGIEIKCPMPINLVNMCIKGVAPDEYIPQVQANMWVTGRKWWDLVLWGPERGLPNAVHRVKADPELHEAFAEHVAAFCQEVKMAENRLRSFGAGLSEEELAMRNAIEDELNPTKDW